MNIWYWAGAIVLLGYSVIPTYTAKLLHRVRRKRTGNTLYLWTGFVIYTAAAAAARTV